MKRFTLAALFLAAIPANADNMIAILKNSSTVERRDAATGAFKGSISVSNATDVGCDGETIAVLLGNGTVQRYNAQNGSFQGQSAFSTEGYPAAPDPYPMIAKMRNNAANQIFASLHPSVLKIRRVIGSTKSVSAKQAIRLANAGLWAEATAAAEQGVQELPTDPEARYILAIVYQGTGRYADADKVLRQLVGMSPNGKYANAIRENQAVWHNAARFQQQM